MTLLLSSRFGVRRAGSSSHVDWYATYLNYTSISGAVPARPDLTGIYNFNDLANPYNLPAFLTSTGVPTSAPSFAGYFESSDGWRMVCLTSVRDKGAIICLRNKLLPNGTAASHFR